MRSILALSQIAENPIINAFVWFAIICLIIWGVYALINATGITIPQPVKIVFYVLGGILLILLAVKLFNLVL